MGCWWFAGRPKAVGNERRAGRGEGEWELSHPADIWVAGERWVACGAVGWGTLDLACGRLGHVHS